MIAAESAVSNLLVNTIVRWLHFDDSASGLAPEWELKLLISACQVGTSITSKYVIPAFAHWCPVFLMCHVMAILICCDGVIVLGFRGGGLA